MTRNADARLWELMHTERAALAADLASLSEEQWRTRSLCGAWDVEDVVAHLTAAASVGRWAWLRSIVGARFRPDVHNQRRLSEHKGGTPAETLERFRSILTSTVTPSSDIAAFLGEVVVHSEDIRRPLGLTGSPSVDALTLVAEYYARRDFAVPSRTRAAGLELRADDGPFAAGTGPQVTGPTLALVMAMAGRAVYVDDLAGAGVATLRSRLVAA